MEFIIDSLYRYGESGSLSDVITNASYHFIDSSSDGSEVYVEKYCENIVFPPVSSDDFIAFGSLNTSTIRGWIEDSYGNNWGSYTSSIQNSISASLSSRVTDGNEGTIKYVWPTGSYEVLTDSSRTGSYYTS